MKFDRLYNLIFEANEPILLAFNADDIKEYGEKRDNIVYNILTDFVQGKPKVTWTTIKAARLKKIWKDFGTLGFVRDEKGLETIKEQMLNNIIKLEVCTALVGHSQERPEDLIESAGYEDDIDLENPQVAEKFYWDFFSTQSGQDILSDYGLKPLQNLWPSIRRAENAEQALYAIDKALNIVHQRNDLAALFIEGGTKTLIEISNQ